MGVHGSSSLTNQLWLVTSVQLDMSNVLFLIGHSSIGCPILVSTGRNQNGPSCHDIDANLCKTHMKCGAERPKRLIRPIRAGAKRGNHEGKQDSIDIASPNRFLHS